VHNTVYLVAGYCQHQGISIDAHSHLGSSTSQPPPTALASAPLIPFISCADRCTVLGPRRIRLLAHYLDCTVAHHAAQTPPSSCTHTHRPHPPLRPAQTQTWAPTPSGGMSFPLRPPLIRKGKDASSAMEPRRASELGSSWRWWSCRLASPAGCSVVQCYLSTLPPAHARANLHTHSSSPPNTPHSSQPAC
jgi:hypothetical protein